MKCFTCKTKMVCFDDVNTISIRIDFVKCPKCGSEADIIYGNNGEYINRVDWRRGQVNK
jgi:ssDNA-binding Zn-finger/Zn-ribbon topoisomerase 1